jgi:E3 Ubiquitin ligase
MVIGGVILLILAVIFYFVSRSNSGQLDALNATDTYTAQLLGELHKKITTALGKEAFAQPCEIEGVIESDAPLIAPSSMTPCVAFTRTVTREYEERVTSTDSNGKRETRTERRSDTVESQDRRAKFFVRDATGRTMVLPEEAEIDMVEISNSFEDEPSSRWSGSTRTLGKRTVETALQVGVQVFVLGCAVDHGGAPAVGKGPKEKKLRFMISRQSERELAGSAQAWARNMLYATWGSGALGALLLILGLLS